MVRGAWCRKWHQINEFVLQGFSSATIAQPMLESPSLSVFSFHHRLVPTPARQRQLRLALLDAQAIIPCW
jgi:hypothetical protein